MGLLGRSTVGDQAEVIEDCFRAAGPRRFAAQVRVGRIVEVRVRRLVDLTDIASLNAAVFAAVRRVGPPAVICADFRRASPLPGDVGDAWSRAMRDANPALARSAILLDPTNAMFNLQIERIVRCACNPARRLFADIGEMRDWIDNSLTLPERDALERFLAESLTPSALLGGAFDAS